MRSVSREFPPVGVPGIPRSVSREFPREFPEEKVQRLKTMSEGVARGQILLRCEEKGLISGTQAVQLNTSLMAYRVFLEEAREEPQA